MNFQLASLLFLTARLVSNAAIAPDDELNNHRPRLIQEIVVPVVPTNDVCDDATLLEDFVFDNNISMTNYIEINGTIEGATSKVLSCTAEEKPYVFYQFTASRGARYKISTCHDSLPSSFNTTLFVGEGSCDDVGCNSIRNDYDP